MNEPKNAYASVEEIDATPWIELLTERFGFPEGTFDAFIWHQPNRKAISLVNSGHQAPSKPEPSAIGMPFLTTKSRYPKMTTGATLAFGDAATRNIIELTEAQTDKYFSRQCFPIDPSQTKDCTGMGYVIARFEGVTLGMGLYRPARDELEPQLDSLYPKAHANHAGRSALGAPTQD